MKKIRFRFSAVAVVIAILGCADMPEISAPTGTQIPPRLVLGPYLEDSSEGRRIRFQTNRPCVAGLRRGGRVDAKVERYAAYGVYHVLPLPADEGGRNTLLLDNRIVAELETVPPPAVGAPATVAFLGGPADAAVYAQAAAHLPANLDGLVFASPLYDAVEKSELWARDVFSPLSAVARRAPFHFLPGTRADVPAELYPPVREEVAVWTRTIGCLRLLAADGTALRTPAKSAKLLDWLERRLAERPEGVEWTVLLLSEPVLGERAANARLLQALEGRLAGRIPLVVSGGAGCYHRALPVSGGEGLVRFVNQSGTRILPPGAGREYTAVTGDEPGLGLLRADADRLEWQAIGMSGRPLDAVAIRAGADDRGEPSVDRQQVLAGALAEQALRREALAVARQACRAVASPDQAQILSFRLANPTGRPFEGRLAWEGPAGARPVSPAEAGFALEPGQERILRFKIGAGGGEPPVLRVEAKEIGFARQPLLLAPRRTATVPLIDGACEIDGIFETEGVWRAAAEFGDLFAPEGGTPTHKTLCKVAAGEEGLLVAFRCEAEDPVRLPAEVTEHDGPVYRDESVEIFVDPTAQARDYLQFSVNIKGVALDRSGRLGLAWNPPWRKAVRCADRYYDVEILLPWRSLGLTGRPAPGAVLALNVCRNDTLWTAPPKKKKRRRDAAGGLQEEGPPPAAGYETVQWADTDGANARSGLYGIVTFAAPAPAAEKK